MNIFLLKLNVGKKLLSQEFLIDGILPNLSNNTSQDYAILNYVVFPKNFEKNLKSIMQALTYL